MKKNIFLTFMSLVLILSLCEGVFRLIAPKSPLGTTYGKIVYKNSDGFRDREFVIPKPADVFRITILGDSFTWGIGLDLSEAAPKQLEKLLAGELINKRIEVMNASIPGYNTVDEFLLLKQKGIKYSPDMVVLIYNLNDIDYTQSLSGKSYDSKGKAINKFSKKKGVRAFVRWFEVRSKLAAFLVPRVGYSLHRIGLIKSAEFSFVEKMFQGYEDTNPGWLESKYALKAMAELCKKNNIVFVVSVYPLLVELDDYQGTRAHTVIRNYCNSIDVPVIDLLEVFKNRSGRSYWINFMDGHPNEKAHAIAAKALAVFLINRINRTASHGEMPASPAPGVVGRSGLPLRKN